MAEKVASIGVKAGRVEDWLAGKADMGLNGAELYRKHPFPEHLVNLLSKFEKSDVDVVLGKLHAIEGPYSGLTRLQHCLLNLALAARGVAPAFRGVISGVTRASGLSTEQKVESNDRQIHDLYWIHRMYRHQLCPSNRKMKQLLEQEQFDFELAAEIVVSVGKVSEKVKKLGIPPSMQVELFALRTQKTATVLKTCRERSRRVEVAVRERALKPTSRIKIDAVPEIMDEFMALELAGGSPDHAAMFWSHMAGGTADKRLTWRLSKRREWFTDQFGITFEDKLAELAEGRFDHADCQREVEEIGKRCAAKRRAV